MPPKRPRQEGLKKSKTLSRKGSAKNRFIHHAAKTARSFRARAAARSKVRKSTYIDIYYKNNPEYGEKMNADDSFEAGLEAQIAAAKQLICKSHKTIKPKALERLDHDMREAFARAMGSLMNGSATEKRSPATDPAVERRIRHFAGRQLWRVAKEKNPDLTPLQHIEETYPDRREHGMCRRDLSDKRIDPKLYQALADWLRPQKDGPQNEIPGDFGLPKKSEITDKILEIAAAVRPLSSAVEELYGEEAHVVRALSALSSRLSKRKSRGVKRTKVPRLAAE